MTTKDIKLETLSNLQEELNKTQTQWQAEKTTLDTLKKKWDQEIKSADNSLNDTVKQCESAIKDVREFYGKQLGDTERVIERVGKIALKQNGIALDNKFFSFDENFNISVDSSGNVYTSQNVKGGGFSVGGAAVGGLLFGVPGAIIGSRKGVETENKTTDTRKVIVSISSETDGTAVSIDPEKEEDLRGLISRVQGTKNRYLKMLEENKPIEEVRDKKLQELVDVYDSKIAELKLKLDKTKADAKLEIDAQQKVFDKIDGEYQKQRKFVESLNPKAGKKYKVFGIIAYIFALLFIIISIPNYIQDNQIPGAVIAAILAAALFILGQFLFIKSNANSKSLAEYVKEQTKTDEKSPDEAAVSEESVEDAATSSEEG